MHIVVCVKQVPNPEAAFSMLKVDEQAKKVIPAAGLQLVMSPFDEQALEAALRIRESTGAAKITALTVGPDSARAVLKHALAMGADEAVLIEDAALDEATAEVTALVLARAIRALEGFDLGLTGRQAADSDAGIVGCGLAVLLDVPAITFARALEIRESSVVVERVLDDGYETIAAELPSLVTISNEIGPARTPNLRETMRAARKPLKALTLSQIAVSSTEVAAASCRRFLERLFVPVKSTRCELIAGADENAQGVALAHRLREARLV